MSYSGEIEFPGPDPRMDPLPAPTAQKVPRNLTAKLQARVKGNRTVATKVENAHKDAKRPYKDDDCYKAMQQIAKNYGVRLNHGVMREWVPDFLKKTGYELQIKEYVKDLPVPPGLDRQKDHVDTHYYRSYWRKAGVMWAFFSRIWPENREQILADLVPFLMRKNITNQNVAGFPAVLDPLRITAIPQLVPQQEMVAPHAPGSHLSEMDDDPRMDALLAFNIDSGLSQDDLEHGSFVAQWLQ